MDIWDGDHLSELALSCLADGQDVVDPVARVHAESCATCAMQIGAMALESHDVGAALNIARERTRAKPAAAFPTLLVAAALVLAAVCGAPALADIAPCALTAAMAAPRVLPALTTSAVALAREPAVAMLSLVGTFTLALLGIAVAWASSRGVSR